jgi:primosomal protein N' (replication factor Y)
MIAGPAEEAEDYGGEIRGISEIIDDVPVLGEHVISLLKWFCDAYLCGFGTAMKTLLPDDFLKGEPAEPPAHGKRRGGSPSATFVYEPEDASRFDRYLSILSDGAPTLVSFPIHSDAKRFFELIVNSGAVPPVIRENTVLYPRLGGNAEWRMWKRLSAGDGLIVIGGQNSVMSPLAGLARVVVEDESNNVWRTMRHPIFNARSLLASRARIESAALVLGGRMPSPRAFMKYDAEHPPASVRRDKHVIFVDMKLAYSPAVEGVSGGLAVSEPLVRETEKALERGEWALWILDRKGYAGEIICEECGAPLKCSKCGGTLRLEGAAPAVRCVSCGAGSPTPDKCPSCAGHLLSARRPGLEALFPLADAAINNPAPIFSSDTPESELKRAVRGTKPCVMVGTRAVLFLCDEVPVGMVGWIDADGEARLGEHDARVRAFSLIWESRRRGISSRERRVLIQTRRPGKDWQRGLGADGDGWRIFWRSELKERGELSMPPYTSLVKIEAVASDIATMSDIFASMGYECWQPEATGKRTAMWVRTKKLSELRRTLSRFFHISRARRGFPSIEVWHE